MHIAPIFKLSTQKENIAFLLILAFSTPFYLFNISYSDIWLDETFTKALVNHSVSQIIGLIKNDFHPPLYFLGLKGFVTVFGSSTFTIRLFSVLGVLSTIILGYVKGQKVFGKSGALYFCLLLISLPMLASQSHDARMYTWGAFTVTGVFLYAALYISSYKTMHLLGLMIFSLAAAYTHYYGLIAAFSANMFIIALLIIRKSSQWKIHLVYSLITALLYLPWLIVLFSHTQKAQDFFWIPAITWFDFMACFIIPFAQKFWVSAYSLPPIIIIYGTTLWAIYMNYIAKKSTQGVTLALSLFIFGLTVLTATIISLFAQPILYHRYITIIVTMLLVPPTLFFMAIKNKWLKGILLTVLLACGIGISVKASYFSNGPFQQSAQHLRSAYPEVKKVFHVYELSVGPFIEYSCPHTQNFWFKNEQTTVITNMDVFKNLQTTSSIDSMLKNNEVFCAIGFANLPYNQKNLKKILSESQLLKADTVRDCKVKDVKMQTYTNQVVLYILKYQCK